MLLTEIYQPKKPKHAAFCYGRVNPPTIGHARLFNTTARASKGGDYYIFLSHTQDSKKNPLDYNTKVDFVKAIYPQHADYVSTGGLKGIMEILEFLYHHNYTDVTFVCGNDRLPTFTKLLNDYNGLEGKPTYFKFNSINIVSSGPRDPDKDDDIAGVSASAAREAAKKGKFEKLLLPFDELWKNHLNEYSIQVSLYSLILEEWGFDIRGSYLVHIGPESEATIYKALDLKDQLRNYLSTHNF